jgi:hypothetical protein
MYTPIHLLPRIDPEKRNLYQQRWEKEEGPALRDKILQMIRDGAGEDFLQWEFENHRLGFLESMWDLKGLNIFSEDLTFAGEGSGWFEAIDFSYALFYHSKFRHAEFAPATFNFTKIYNCEFIDCTFSFSGFYGATLEKVKFTNCNFIEQNGFTNCDVREVEFTNCFVPENIFTDCRFDANTRVSDPIDKAHGGWSLTFEKKELAGIFQSIKEAYSAGGVAKQVRTYFFRQSQAVTRHNSDSVWDRLGGYFLEFLTGYGVRPLRVLRALILLVVLGIGIFTTQVGFENALILTTGGFFTFGGYTDLLKSLNIWFRLGYVLTAFVGIFLTGLYVTVLANVWFRER